MAKPSETLLIDVNTDSESNIFQLAPVGAFISDLYQTSEATKLLSSLRSDKTAASQARSETITKPVVEAQEGEVVGGSKVEELDDGGQVGNANNEKKHSERGFSGMEGKREKFAEEASDNDEDNDDDSSSGRSEKTPALKMSLRKWADYETFESWLAHNQTNLANVPSSSNVLDAAHIKVTTAASLVRKFESARIIESPRDYQIELFEKAKQKNVIAVLDTGSGKTLIAVLLLRHIIEQELERHEQGQPKRVSFFVVDKVALVFQQHAVLECNLSHPIARLSGDRADPRWSGKEYWDGLMQKHMVIVCTADIFLKCLYHSYVGMHQINLLIFDEAHHTKKNHPYARIIKDFYAFCADADQKPKIFGMTASPVDARTNVAQAAYELEALLHSEIATVATRIPHDSQLQTKTERIVYYNVAVRPPQTELMHQLQRLVGGHRLFAKNFQFAQDSLLFLGPWMVDRFWQIIFRSDELAKQEARISADDSQSWMQRDDSAFASFFEGKDGHSGDISAADESDAARLGPSGDLAADATDSINVKALKEASTLVRAHTFQPPSFPMLSNKIRRLCDALLDEFTKPGGGQTRCIVFVEQRYTAMLLADLFQHKEMMIPGLQTGTLIGGRTTNLGGNSLKTQLLSISKFRRGHVNCLFATSVAEEGLDIPDCNLVIRFDLYHTMIQYIQSRGRARHCGSVYIHMAELGNVDHMRLLADNKASENRMRDFCNALPEERKIQGNDVDMDHHLREEKDQPSFEAPSSHAKLTYRSSLVVLAQYVSTLPEPSDGTLVADYSVFHTANGFVCEVSLPSSSPIRHATGRRHSRKQVAKCAAAYAMCLQLYEKKYLDQRFMPVFASKLPAMRNARLAISSKKQEEYKMREKPELWFSLGIPTRLFATVLRLSQPDAMLQLSRPLVLLTRSPLPSIHPFPLFFAPGRASHVECLPVSRPMEAPTDAELAHLTDYTLQAFKDVFSKEYGGSVADCPYFVAPCAWSSHNKPVPADVDVRATVDWAAVAVASKSDEIPWQADHPFSFFRDRFVVDPYDGSRKFFMRRVRRDRTALDPVPEGVPAPKHRNWRQAKTEHNIWNYSVSLWSRARASITVKPDTPVVEADIVVRRPNLLDDRMDDVDKMPANQTCLLVLDTLRISSLSTDVVAMLLNLPPIMHRLESVLIALEATRSLGLPEIPSALALEAFTKDSDNSKEAGSDGDGDILINFQAGMGKNYERLELLGDSFLKLAATLALHSLMPGKDEFQCHVQRMCMVCNRNLFNNALDLHLQEYIRSREFGRTWYPPVVEGPNGGAGPDTTTTGTTATATDSTISAPSPLLPPPQGLILIRGKPPNPANSHHLGDKTIADVSEAIIGAAYLTGRADHSFDLAVKAVHVLVRSKMHPMQRYGDYLAAYVRPDWQTAPATAAQVHMAQTVARTTGYTFRQPRLLRSAFTHASYPRLYENLPTYQRLEFLGDALFDMAAVDFLFHRFPDKGPQWLTEHKMAMVSNQFLAVLAVSLGFHKLVLSFSGDLQKQIMEFVAKVEAARAQAEDDATADGLAGAGIEAVTGTGTGTETETETETRDSPTVSKRQFARDFWLQVTRPPKVLADVLEAYLGAVFVDMDYDYDGAVLPFFRTHVQPYFENMALYDTYASKHPVTRAGALLGRRFGCRHWRAVVRETPDNSGAGCVTFATQAAAGFIVHGRIVGHGLADNGRSAKIAAANSALAKIDSLSLTAFQELTGCDCRARDDDQVGDKGQEEE